MPAEEWNQLHEWLNHFQLSLASTTSVHLRCLHVDLVEDKIIVSGIASTFYSLQQILTGVRAAIGERTPSRPVVLSVAVQGRRLQFPIAIAANAIANADHVDGITETAFVKELV